MEPPRDNFDALQKLLALKRHEVPPPGFFDRLPESIRAELEQAAAHPRGLAGLWELLRSRWRLEPALAGAMLLAVAGIYGIALLGPQAPDASPTTAAAPPPAPSHPQPGLSITPRTQWLAEIPADRTNAGGSLEPRTAAAPPPWLFSTGAGLHSVPVGFHHSSGGLLIPEDTLFASNEVYQPALPGNFDR
ncbi:MAG: hypothetical protein H7A46_07950 [Verrucomicrobiales bacterium]|nr:hypothetical protein [Verrucomicrobiales bacterium]